MSRSVLALLLTLIAAPQFLGSLIDPRVTTEPPKNQYDCLQKVKEWEGWADQVEAQYHELSKEKEALESKASYLGQRNANLEYQRTPYFFGAIFLSFASLGAGAFSVFLLARRIVRAWRARNVSHAPWSAERKQLFVLILAAVWITVVVAVVSFDDTLSGHPVNMFLTVLVRSIPAVLFGGISFWWLRRAKA